jgi:hypothetical protein
MSIWKDFNNATQPTSFDLIPKGTIARVRMTFKPGGYNDPAQGWTGGYATRSSETGSVYLSAEFVLMEGPFARRKVWSNIGLYSPKGDTWANMGRSFIRAALNSARNIMPDDLSSNALAARCISEFSDLDGLEFLVRIDQEKDSRGEWKNNIKCAIEPDNAGYVPIAPATNVVSQSAPNHSVGVRPSASTTSAVGKPAWAQ